ncbi:grass carp reovirus (GCRV)-induced gene 2o [Mobula hypostoma]|uniref:grass carp reovirus (GCRV)-induced gene 2o n=1 Tax=Mobula hypostoma TaxID=723540 RepID=UPI002FC37496
MSRARFELQLTAMAYNSDFTWAEEDGPNFYPPCLESHRAPEDGRQYVMYHGTSAKNARLILKNGFCQSNDGMFGPGVYVSRDLRKASAYPKTMPISQRVVLKLLVNVGKVKKIHYQGHPLQKTWHQHGYDTAWCPPGCGMVQSGLEEDCIWDPRRIKVIDQIHPSYGQDQWEFFEYS